MRRIISVMASVTLFLGILSCSSTKPIPTQTETVYLKNNIHYQEAKGVCKASYANYTDPGLGHEILPVNTPVFIGKWKRGFSIINSLDNTMVYFDFNIERMNMAVAEYLKIITSPTRVSLDGLSEKDRKGIEDGKAYPGMTKDGVKMALGYPATHKTPSLESNRWIYWTNRWDTVAVEFNDQGIVTSVVQ